VDDPVVAWLLSDNIIWEFSWTDTKIPIAIIARPTIKLIIIRTIFFPRGVKIADDAGGSANGFSGRFLFSGRFFSGSEFCILSPRVVSHCDSRNNLPLFERASRERVIWLYFL
jgi:hypothetical protein